MKLLIGMKYLIVSRDNVPTILYTPRSVKDLQTLEHMRRTLGVTFQRPQIKRSRRLRRKL